jgi:murein L,D-transpeptidase YcbB/YkuD
MLRAARLRRTSHALLFQVALLLSFAAAWVPACAAVAQNPATTLLWFRNGHASTQALALLAQLRDAERYGLRPRDYGGEALAAQVSEPALAGARDTLQWQALDAAISAAALRFATHLHSGRVPARRAGFDVEQARPAFDGAAAVRLLATSSDTLATLQALEPPFLHYRLLKDALQRYRQLSMQGGLTELPPFKPRSLREGERYAGAPALRRLLQALGDLDARAAEPSDPLLLDAGLCAALRRFQDRHGLPPDGVLGRSTYRALSVPMATRVRQIELTLERWRWLPAFTRPPIIVNIPQFRLFAFRTTDDRVADILQMPVIVGRIFPRNRTPVFMSELRYVVFRPYWDVPPSIVQHEMLAPIRKSIDYLARNNLELVRGEGDDGAVVAPDEASIAALARGELRLRQRPGEGNALGLIKFLMPNGYNVYLHSTPEQHLFNEAQRAFSHGCIRVADPLALAAQVLHDTPGDWTPQAIDAAMHGEATQRIALARPIPVLVLYGTALAKEDGQIMFFEDIYGHDRRLERLIGQ